MESKIKQIRNSMEIIRNRMRHTELEDFFYKNNQTYGKRN